VTEQESSSSSEPVSEPSKPEDVHRYTLVAAIGIMGTQADCQRFMELMVADFNQRCARANKKIFWNRITLLPVEETIPEDAKVQ
jgi:hypothetical protein